MRAFPPRLPEQPIFYPVTTEDYAIKIARDWNVRASGSGYVTRFEVLKSYLDGYRIETAGGRAHQEYWIPAEDRSEEHTSELQSLMRISYAVFCLKKKNINNNTNKILITQL